jgi:hypothetical protein
MVYLDRNVACHVFINADIQLNSSGAINRAATSFQACKIASYSGKHRVCRETPFFNPNLFIVVIFH